MRPSRASGGVGIHAMGLLRIAVLLGLVAGIVMWLSLPIGVTSIAPHTKVSKPTLVVPQVETSVRDTSKGSSEEVEQTVVTRLLPVGTVRSSSAVATDSFVDVTYPHCSAADRNAGVLLVGNRPVGTYLCEYFPRAKRVRGGCALQCEGIAVGNTETPSTASEPMTCTILAKGSVEQMKTADIVVNHHGPVPVRHRPEQVTLFYSGESNKSEGKKALQQYQEKYSDVVSFHHHRPYYFTWTHRFAETFHNIASGVHKFHEPSIDAIIIFVSRCGKGGRDGIIRRLMKAYEVRSFGSCVRTHRVSETHPECTNTNNRYKEKECVFRKYRFALALDNTVEEDYVTEKVYHSLVFGAVPIYDGAPNVDDFLPSPKAIIRLREFVQPPGGDFRANPELIDVVALRKKLTETAALGREAPELDWRREASSPGWTPRFMENMAHPEPTCAVCAEALNRRCRAKSSGG